MTDYYAANPMENVEIWDEGEFGRTCHRALFIAHAHSDLCVVRVFTDVGLGWENTIIPVTQLQPPPPAWAHFQLAQYQEGEWVDVLLRGIWVEGRVYNSNMFGLDIVDTDNDARLLHHAAFGPNIRMDRYRVALQWTNQGWLFRSTGLPAAPPPPPLPQFPPPVIEPVPSLQPVITYNPIPANVPVIDLDIHSDESLTSSSSSSGNSVLDAQRFM